jgi:hypothetical protein
MPPLPFLAPVDHPAEPEKLCRVVVAVFVIIAPVVNVSRKRPVNCTILIVLGASIAYVKLICCPEITLFVNGIPELATKLPVTYCKAEGIISINETEYPVDRLVPVFCIIIV